MNTQCCVQGCKFERYGLDGFLIFLFLHNTVRSRLFFAIVQTSFKTLLAFVPLKDELCFEESFLLLLDVMQYKQM